MRKPTFCLYKNKDADQLRGDCEADQRLCFRYIDSTIPLLSKSEISSLWLSSVAVQPGLCLTRSETRMLVFSRQGSFLMKFLLAKSIDPDDITKTRPCNIQRFFTAVKMTIFSLIFFTFFHIFAQNIDCGYMLEAPQ